MILVTVHCIDNSEGTFNGAYGMHFYNLNEAQTFAREESNALGSYNNTQSWTRVYYDGVLLSEYVGGSPI